MPLLVLLLLIVIIFIALYLFAIAPRTSRRSDTAKWRGVQFAHRGYHCIERGIPENSMAAFRAALSRGCGIELDVHITKDGQVAVFHDDTLKRACGADGSVESHTYEELQNYYLFHTSEKIPLLSDVLALTDGRVPLLIEFKIPGYSTEVCEKAWNILKHYKGNYMVQSFNTAGLFWFRRYAPCVLRGQLSCDLSAESMDKPRIVRFLVTHLFSNVLGRPDFISYRLRDLPAWNVSICRRLFKIPVAVWTLRTNRAVRQGISGYDMQIFEKENEDY